MTNTNINYANADARFVARLVENGEWDRALTHANLLVASITRVMADLEIERTAIHIHDATLTR